MYYRMSTWWSTMKLLAGIRKFSTNMEWFPTYIMWKKQNAEEEIGHTIYVRKQTNTKIYTYLLIFVKNKYRMVKWETNNEIYYLQG